MHGSPFGPHRQSGLQFVCHQDTNQRPVRLSVLIRSRRKSFTQLRCMRGTHRRAIQKQCPRRALRHRRSHLCDELLKDSVAAFLHERKRQCLPRLIISSRVARWCLTVFAPFPDAFAGIRPEAGRQTPQQLQHGGFQGCATGEPLGDHQPQHYQRGVNAVIASDPGIGLCLIKKVAREEFLESRRKAAEGGFRNERRERECGSCVKSQTNARNLKRQVLYKMF